MRVDSCRVKEAPTLTVTLISYTHENDTMNKQMDCLHYRDTCGAARGG